MNPASRTPQPALGGKSIGYVRVSDVDQNEARQLDGWQMDKMFMDKASGKDTQRPQFQAMLDYVREGDHVYVHSLDRMGRSLVDIEGTIRGLNGRGVAVTFTTQGLTFTGDDSPMSVLLRQMLGAFGQFERSLILERQREGIAIAKRNGVYKGRKPSLDEAGKAALRLLLEQQVPKAQIAAKLGISRTTLYANLK